MRLPSSPCRMPCRNYIFERFRAARLGLRGLASSSLRSGNLSVGTQEQGWLSWRPDRASNATLHRWQREAQACPLCLGSYRDPPLLVVAVAGLKDGLKEGDVNSLSWARRPRGLATCTSETCASFHFLEASHSVSCCATTGGLTESCKSNVETMNPKPPATDCGMTYIGLF